MPILNGGLCIAATLMARTNAWAVNSNADQAWGTPQVIDSPWEFGRGHDATTRMPDKTFWLMDKKRSNNANDEAIVVAYVARQIVAHGGHFCATQIRSRNSGKSGCPKIWTMYQNPAGKFQETCFWLCEPGYSGENCTAGRAKSDDACKYTKLSREKLSADLTYNEDGGLDDAAVEGLMSANNYTGFFRFGHGKSKKGNEQDVVLAAKKFLENGHGIIASPATLSAHGGMWNNDDYSDEWLDCKYGDSNITITTNGAKYTEKTLCMPGFDGPDCSTSLCKICDDELTVFDEKTGQCSACIENHVHKNGKCTPCPDGQTAVPGKDICLSCKKTEYISGDKCMPRKQISQQDMYKCYPNTNSDDFVACTRDTCDDQRKVACLTDDKKLGTKVCTNKKWGKCQPNPR